MGHRERKIFVTSGNKKYLGVGLFLLAGSAPALCSDDLGRLFFNATERQALNEKRRAPKPQPVASTMKNPIPEPEPKPQADITESVPLREPKITGQVIRSSGNNTIWVNHAPNYLPNSSRRSPVE
jgi:hypothetical protein